MRLHGLLAAVAAFLFCGVANAAVVISVPAKPSSLERLAALEVQRYVYLRTGGLPKTASGSDADRIVISRGAKSLKPQEYSIKTTGTGALRTWWIVGGDDVGVLYGAYRFCEKLGVRFYLHGDVIPDKKLARLPDVNETAKPIFSIRGIQPFHDFPEGPDWWNTDDYLNYIGQLAKMRMNFIGLHTYPWGTAEPCVWIGMSADTDAKGRVSSSYPARWANTALDKWFGYAAMPTSEY